MLRLITFPIQFAIAFITAAIVAPIALVMFLLSSK